MFVILSLSWTVSTPSPPPQKHKHPVVAGSLGSFARRNLRTISVEYNSDICEITDEISTDSYIAKISLLIALVC